MARSTAALWPLTTTWPPPLSLATAHDLALRRLLAGLLGRPRARCRAAPPWRRRRPAPPAASPGRAASEAARRRRVAARRPPPGPNIRPANGRRRRRPAPTAACRRPSPGSRTTARLTAISAGWAFSVRVRSDSGPSRISFDELLLQRLVDLLEDVAGRGEGARPGRRPCRRPGSPGPERRMHGSWARFSRFLALFRASLYPTRAAGRNALLSGDLPV